MVFEGSNGFERFPLFWRNLMVLEGSHGFGGISWFWMNTLVLKKFKILKKSHD